MYRLIGDLAGPSFFSINETTGYLYVRADLGLGFSQKYTLRVQVKYIHYTKGESTKLIDNVAFFIKTTNLLHSKKFKLFLKNHCVCNIINDIQFWDYGIYLCAYKSTI